MFSLVCNIESVAELVRCVGVKKIAGFETINVLKMCYAGARNDDKSGEGQKPVLKKKTDDSE